MILHDAALEHDIVDVHTLDWRNVDFTASRRKELDGLIELDVFEPADASAAEGKRLYGSRFVDEVKHQGTPDAMEKTRLVVQGYGDRNHGLLTHAPTVQRASQRLALCLETIFALPNGLKMWIRDVTQAYIQSDSNVDRDIFIRAPKELELPPGKILKVLRPLYGLPEAALHWWKAYHGRHKDKLEMIDTAYDPCLLHTPGALAHVKRRSNDANKDIEKAQGIVCLQTDDTLNVGNQAFEDREEEGISRFRPKPKQYLKDNTPTRFKGATVTLNGEGIDICQPEQARKVKLVALPKDTHVKDAHAKDAHTEEVYGGANCAGDAYSDEEHTAEYISQRARDAYIASTCRPDLAFAFAKAAQHPKPNIPEFQALNTTLQSIIDAPTKGISFKSQDISTLRMAVFVDASFANNHDLSSQLGILVSLRDKKGITNIIHWTSVKCKRVVRSALASELYAMAHGFDLASALKDAIKGIDRSLSPFGYLHRFKVTV